MRIGAVLMPNMSHPRVNFQRRRLLALGAGAFSAALLGASDVEAANATLVVFVHLDAKLRLLQSVLEKLLPDVDVRTFSRFGDVKSALATADAVLALEPVVSQLGLSIVKSGTRAGKVTEPYTLVSTNPSLKINSVSSVGFVDILGRRDTTKFVQGILRGNAQVQRVTKLQDLLPLLQLKMAEAILVPSRLVPSFREKTHMQLFEVLAPNEVPLPVIGASTPRGRKLADRLQSANGNLNNLLGIQAWR